MNDFLTRPPALVLLCAFSYVVATVGMKLAAQQLSLSAILVVAVGGGLAVTAEILLLRRADLGIVYLTVIGVETLMILGIGVAIGEGLSLRQVSGALVVMAGLAMVTL